MDVSYLTASTVENSFDAERRLAQTIKIESRENLLIENSFDAERRLAQSGGGT